MKLKIAWGRWLGALVLALLICTKLVPGGVTQAEMQTVKVGFFHFPGYHIVDALTGERSGYGYEYLQEIAKYTDWKYDYVGYSESWASMQRMLEEGKIDILTSAQKTPEREAKFLFSSRPIGTSTTLLTAKSGNQKYLTKDYRQYNGMRVGMLKGNSRNKSFVNFAQEHGFNYQPVYYDSMTDLTRALQSGLDIDTIVTSNLRDTKNEWVVAEFDASPFYVMVRKDRPDLLAEVDEALNKLAVDYPALTNQLATKYYIVDAGVDIPFTVEERNYINQLNQDKIVLKGIVNTDRAPISGLKDNTLEGIIPDVLQEIIQRSGLPIKLVASANREDYKKLAEDSNIDLAMDTRFDYFNAESKGYKLSDPYVSFGISRLSLKNTSKDKMTSIAALRDSDITAAYINKVVRKSSVTVVQYNSVEECVEAVRSGKQDAVYLYTYVAQKIVQDDTTNSFQLNLMPEYRTQFAVAVADEQDPRILGILNKTIRSLPRTVLDEAILAHTLKTHEVFSLRRLIYANPMVALFLLGILAVIISWGIYNYYRARNSRLEQEKTAEFEQFLYNVCRSNDSAVEFKLQEGIVDLYEAEGKKLLRTSEKLDLDRVFKARIYPADYVALKDKISYEALVKLVKTGEAFYFECRMKENPEDEKYNWCAVNLQGMLQDVNHPLNVIGLRRNINAAKQEEELKRQTLNDALNAAKAASAAKGSFLSRMSHEIRTPMNAIIGYVTLAKLAKEDYPKIVDYLNKSELAAKHLLALINDVLDISAIESGHMKIADESFDLKQLFSTISTLYYNQTQAKQVAFSVTMQDLTEEWVVGDKLRLNQILLNLLSNAVKFTPAGGAINVSVKQASLRDKQVVMQFAIEDNGIGMSEDMQRRLFTPFEQENAGIAQKYGGTGLGLAITKNLVTMMHGSISVQSKEGVGTRFVVTIPFERSPENERHQAQEHNFSKLRALVVDDQKSDRDYIKALLKQCSIKCDLVESGADALKQLERRQGSPYAYNLCFVDWQMSGMNGIETAKAIRKACGDEMPIIIITAYDVTAIAQEAEAVQAKVVAKPLFPSTMMDLLVTTYGAYHVPEEAAVPSVDLTGMQIMLVEDNPMNMEIAKAILVKAGLKVEEAHDGREAVDKFLAAAPGTYAAILMDIQMPVMDGYEATKAIRTSQHPEAASLPIIAMTANAFNEDVTKALAAGMNAHLSKPVNFQKLFDVLQKFKQQ